MIKGYWLKNILMYLPTVIKHRWWDSHFQLIMIDKMLEDCENNWGKNTHYVGDTFTLGRIRVIRKYIKLALDDESYEKKAISLYARNLYRLWD